MELQLYQPGVLHHQLAFSGIKERLLLKHLSPTSSKQEGTTEQCSKASGASLLHLNLALPLSSFVTSVIYINSKYLSFLTYKMRIIRIPTS